MNRIIQNIATVCLSIVVWSWLPAQLYAQCKVGGSATTKGEFTINGTKVSVQGDGGGLPTAPNNIPIKICEGEVIKLKSSLNASSLSNVNYWITPYNTYNGRPRAMSPIDLPATVGSYTTLNGDFDVKMATKDASNPDGFNTYNGPGLYVISQGDNSTPAGAIVGDFHHACQVIEIIAPQQPVANVSVCSGRQVQITLPTNPANNFDDYEIVFNATQGSLNPILKTGKPTSYPFSISSGTTLPDNQDRIITIKGSSITGGCPSPVNNLGLFSISGSIINRPAISSIVGTTKADEFKLAVSAQNGITRNIYMRDPLSSNVFVYTGTPFKNFASTATSGLDSIDIKVADPAKTYCFQVEALDANCPSTGSNIDLRSNEEICTTPIKVTPQSNKNVITWNRAIGSVLGGTFAFYQVERLNANGTTDKLFPIINNISEISIEDDNTTCGNEYTYRVQTNYGLASYSQKVKVTAISDDIPSKIPLFFATMTNDAKNPKIQGDFDPANTPLNIKADNFKFYRANSLNGTYSLVNTGNLLFNDLTVDANKQSYCYYMTWTNLCNKESNPSDKICTVYLKPTGSTVNWTRESAISVGTDSYIVQRVDPTTGNNIKEIASNLININSYNTQALPESEGQEIYVQIEARPIGWNIGNNRAPNVLSNIIKIFRPSIAISPQIFTPNGDGQNDKFIVEGKFIKNLKMTIYDRWGNAIFYAEQAGYPTHDAQVPNSVIGWDGIMNNGNKAMEGSYAYRIEVEDTVGQVTIKEGALLLAY